jgi:hypothetical protein
MRLGTTDTIMIMLFILGMVVVVLVWVLVRLLVEISRTPPHFDAGLDGSGAPLIPRQGSAVCALQPMKEHGTAHEAPS